MTKNTDAPAKVRAGQSPSLPTRLSRRFSVALPTYRARLKDGTWVGAEPRTLSRFVADLANHPVDGLEGVVWFRLGHRADSNAWSASTLMAVVRGSDLEPHFISQLVAGPSGAWDVVLKNAGSVDAQAPQRVAFSGQLDVIDGVRGFAVDGQTLASTSPPRLRAGETVVIGFVRGKGVDVYLP